MIVGTLYETAKMMVMKNELEQKKKSGDIFGKKKKELTPQEQQLKLFNEQLENNRKNAEYSALYNKVMSGEKLSPDEEEKLRQHDVKTYNDYKASQAEQEAYEEKLKRCKTKDEAQRLHTEKMQAELSKIKNIDNNPYISEGEKLKMIQVIHGKTVVMGKIYKEFTESVEYKELPTEAEIQKARTMEREAEDASMREKMDEAKEEDTAMQEKLLDADENDIKADGAKDRGVKNPRNESTKDSGVDAKLSEVKAKVSGEVSDVDEVLDEIHSIMRKYDDNRNKGEKVDVIT